MNGASDRFIRTVRFICALVLLSPAFVSLAGQLASRDLTAIVEADEAPDGVVLELLAWDENTWTWAAPLIREFRQQMQAKFPSVDIAVVSHGAEQFQLTRETAVQQPEAIEMLGELSGDGVNIHVCGTHSSWEDVPADAYLDFVDVSPSGPAQINDYIKLGYRHILLRKPE